MSKEVYIITTSGCVGCSIMTYHLRKINHLSSHKYIINIVDFKKVPEFISLNVPYTDFPTLVCVENNIIKYHKSGTMTMKHLKEVLKDINFI
ncbi:MAG: Thioredoxin [Bacteriophage sp.]|nr:MAG: Thioredoxin [Bacteriophage sp.]